MSKTKPEIAVKRDIYTETTQRIVRLLESGEIPWRKPWKSASDAQGLPIRANGEYYSGVNVLALWQAQQNHNYASNQWMTFKQAQALGGSVKKGEKATEICFASTFEKRKELENGDESKERIPFLKRYWVFNVDQTEGLPERFYAPLAALSEFERIEAAERFFSPIPAKIEHKGNRACYWREADKIDMPKPESFAAPEAYYSTLAHELTHWTGAPDRLARKKGTIFGDADYAKEELVAELGAAFTCGHIRILNRTETESAAYIQSWIKHLQNDKRFIFKAAAAASRAFEYLRAYSEKTEEVSA